MRVIAGTARSMPLKSVDGLDTRPTQDRIKETLFNVIQAEVFGARFLDLFAGSGAIGIEALSRGASEAYFVENAKPAVKCIKDNLEFTKFQDKAVVMECEVLTAVSRLAGKGIFDIVHMDPPYNMGYEKQALEALSGSGIIDEYTLIIIEASLDTDFSYLAELGYTIIKQKNYKNNKHMFLNRANGGNN